jgi:hypothetical protein
MKLTIGLNKLEKVTEIDKKSGSYIDCPFFIIHIFRRISNTINITLTIFDLTRSELCKRKWKHLSKINT